MGKLTEKQKQFCKEYVVDFNATQAAKRAGYSAKTAGQIGEQNLKKLEIQGFIGELQIKQTERLEITADDLTQFFKGIVESEDEQTKDRIKAAENLSKRIGYFEKDNNQKGIGIANALKAYAAKFDDETED
jgi:phage terminase small subunit